MLILRALSLGGLIACMWALEIVDVLVLHGALDRHGIRPRDPEGLLGITWSPLLHHGFAHLAANTTPLLVLGGLVVFGGLARFWALSVVITLLGGFGVWLVGKAGTIHLGASLLIFGYFGFVVARGWFERKIWPILVSAAVLFLYGGLLWGVLPGQPGISWEGHLFGFLSGVLGAHWFTTDRPQPRRSRVPRTASGG